MDFLGIRPLIRPLIDDVLDFEIEFIERLKELILLHIQAFQESGLVGRRSPHLNGTYQCTGIDRAVCNGNRLTSLLLMSTVGEIDSRKRNPGHIVPIEMTLSIRVYDVVIARSSRVGRRCCAYAS